MAIRLPQSRGAGQAPQSRKSRSVSPEAIIQVMGRNPIGEGLNVAGQVLGQAIQRRNQLRNQQQQADLLAKAFESGDLTGLSPENQIDLMKIRGKEQNQYIVPGSGPVFDTKAGQYVYPPSGGTPAGTPKPLDPVKQGNLDLRKASEATKLRQQFIVASKPFSEITQAYDRIQSSAETPSPAGDLSLIYNYMKILDPSSVVRESEFAQAAKTGAYGERVKAYINSILNGQRLTDEIRKDFIFQSDALYKGQEQLHKQREEQFSSLAKNMGLDPKNVVFRISKPSKTSSGVVTREMARELLRQAGGDKEKAKALARSKGLRF